MARWFDLEPCDEDFVATAPYRYVYPIELPVAPEEVWAGLTADQPLKWCKLLSGGYTSDRPFGVGTTRTVKLARLLTLRERFDVWEEGRRHGFQVEQMNAPMFRRFAEDYLVEPTPVGCRFTWTFAFEPGTLTKPAGPLNRPINKVVYDSLVRDTSKHFGGR
ncbi:SRPBCC family protein [Antrihabitans sp. YC2-6]|uniref:SRPBCC family protein n=1 Tax=Antrihabitans sp. YC2-6 TaxID=2799498 RepID=UPI0018F65663|nr:SRPBCC family protein [Antrihabitans sp. YC2-6]MBJ8345439.1 SRPBCC family protein [Antrihabitans sp. YC2-6]